MIMRMTPKAGVNCGTGMEKTRRDRKDIAQKKNVLEEKKAHQNCNSNHLRIHMYSKCSVVVLLIYNYIYFFSLYSILTSPPSKKVGEFGAFSLRWKWLLEIAIDNEPPSKEIACSPPSSSTKGANQNLGAAEAAGLIHGEARRSRRSVPNTVILSWFNRAGS